MLANRWFKTTFKQWHVSIVSNVGAEAAEFEKQRAKTCEHPVKKTLGIYISGKELNEV